MGVNPSPDQYCRQIEAYLCRRNDGHLVRIVGPAFEQVSGWADRGVPLTVACVGIDRYFERYYAKGPRRRPVRIEFCEADVLDAFDEWRRAVGVVDRAVPGNEAGGVDDPDGGAGGRRGSLPAHLERAVARLVALRGGDDQSMDGVLEATVRELDVLRAGSRGVRGAARVALLDRLRELDRGLLAAGLAQYTDETRAALQAEAEAELVPFRDRLLPEAYQRALVAARDRLVRERRRLPVLSFD